MAFTQVMALAASFVATHVYYASLEEGEKEVMDQSVAWMIVVGLSSSWLIFFTCFLLIMKKSYLSTFFSLLHLTPPRAYEPYLGPPPQPSVILIRDPTPQPSEIFIRDPPQVVHFWHVASAM